MDIPILLKNYLPCWKYKSLTNSNQFVVLTKTKSVWETERKDAMYIKLTLKAENLKINSNFLSYAITILLSILSQVPSTT